MNHTVTPEQVKALYDKEVEKHRRDKRQHGPLSLDEAMIRATRTMVYSQLQLQLPTPPPEKDEDPDVAHIRQKAHGKALWKETDRLIEEAKLGSDT